MQECSFRPVSTQALLKLGKMAVDKWGRKGAPTIILNIPCNPNSLQFYGLYLLTKGYLLLNCRLLEPQVYTRPYIHNGVAKYQGAGKIADAVPGLGFRAKGFANRLRT